MKKTTLWAVMMALAAGAYAQQNPTAVKYSKIITAADAKKHLSIIASDEYEGRETGKPGADKAAKYLANEYKKLGFLPANKGSYFLDVPLQETRFKVDKFTLNGTTQTFAKDFYATGLSPKKTVDAAEIVFVGYGSAEELTTDIAGKVVLLIGEERPNKDGSAPQARRGMSPARQQLMQNLYAKGPTLILSANPRVALLAPRFANAEGNMSIKKPNAAPTTNSTVAFAITTEVADAILKSTGKTYAQAKQAIDGGTTQTQVLKVPVSATFGSETKDVKAVDIVAYMPGTDPKLKSEVLVISAHYDHIGISNTGNDKINNGADDDGSGTVGILEIARAFAQAKKEGKGPKRTLLFLGNVGEEKGLLGSEYYTDHAPVFPLEKTIANLNVDMIGRVGVDYQKSADSANYVYPIGSAMLSTTMRKVMEDANNNYTKLKLDYIYDDPNDVNRFYYRSDHYNFAKHNVPIIFFFNGVHEDYHRPSDEVSKINFPLLAKRAQLVFFIGWDLANRAQRPVVDVAQPGK